MKPSVIFHVKCNETACDLTANADCLECGWAYCNDDFDSHKCDGKNPFKKIRQGICLLGECKQKTGAIECKDCGWQFCPDHLPGHVCDPDEIPF